MSEKYGFNYIFSRGDSILHFTDLTIRIDGNVNISCINRWHKMFTMQVKVVEKVPLISLLKP